MFTLFHALIFGAHVLYFRVSKTPKGGRKPTDSSNAKMKVEGSKYAHFVETYILPLDEVKAAQETPFTAKGGRAKQARLELKACSEKCPHRADNLSEGVKPCYVDLMRQIKPAINGAAKALDNGAHTQLEVGNYELRLTAWGDVGVLNDEALETLTMLQELAGAHLSYTADYTAIERGLKAQLSVTSLEAALEADSQGLKVYMSGTEDEKQAFRTLAKSPVYRCPVHTPSAQDMGCTTCPLRCDGSRHILSP